VPFGVSIGVGVQIVVPPFGNPLLLLLIISIFPEKDTDSTPPQPPGALSFTCCAPRPILLPNLDVIGDARKQFSRSVVRLASLNTWKRNGVSWRVVLPFCSGVVPASYSAFAGYI